MKFDLNVDDLIEDLGIHFDVCPLNTSYEGWTVDNEDNIDTTQESRKIITRWLINKGLIEPEEL